MEAGSVCTDELRLRVRANEAERLAVLSQYEVLDTAGEPDFEMLVEVVQVRCEVPMAAITFVDRERMWLKASRGFPVPAVPRMLCFCSVCMHDDRPMMVKDASLDSRFQKNALVLGEPKVRFYAGFPIRSREGLGLGTVCVIDTKIRSLSTEQMKLMEKTRNWVEAIIEVRRLAAPGPWGAGYVGQIGRAERKAERAWKGVRRLM